MKKVGKVQKTKKNIMEKLAKLFKMIGWFGWEYQEQNDKIIKWKDHKQNQCNSPVNAKFHSLSNPGHLSMS
jgi:hypothetical protein